MYNKLNNFMNRFHLIRCPFQPERYIFDPITVLRAVCIYFYGDAIGRLGTS